MSRIARAAAIALALWTCVAAPSLAQSDEQAHDIARAEQAGRELYEHDQAAWHATDALFADLGRSAQSQLRGWVTEREGDAIVVTFVATNETESLYRAVYRGGSVQEHAAVHAPLTAAQTRLYRARQVALHGGWQPCSRQYNSVTLPRTDSTTVDVYIMPGTTDPGAVLIGGYYRLAVDETGAVVETQAFSRSCLTLRRDDPAMRNAEALWFTHIQTPLPTETHVFINLTQNLPLYISAPSGLWQIQGGHISPLRDEPH